MTFRLISVTPGTWITRYLGHYYEAIIIPLGNAKRSNQKEEKLNHAAYFVNSCRHMRSKLFKGQ